LRFWLGDIRSFRDTRDEHESQGAKIEGDIDAYDKATDYLRQDPKTAEMIDQIEADPSITIRTNTSHNDSFDPETRTINWDPTSALRTSGGPQSPALGLAHEMRHATGWRWLTNILHRIPAGRYSNLEEWRVIRLYEVGAARRLGEGVRFDHGGSVYRVTDPRLR
jgi:hypothetical protein